MLSLELWCDEQIATLIREGKVELTIPSYQINDPIARAKMWIIEQKEKQILLVENEKQLKVIQENKPLVEFGTQIANSSDCIDIGDYVKVINDENINLGRNKLFKWFRDNGYLRKNNTPYQKYINNNYFELKETPIKTPYGEKISFKTQITGIGQIKITERLRREMMN